MMSVVAQYEKLSEIEGAARTAGWLVKELQELRYKIGDYSQRVLPADEAGRILALGEDVFGAKTTKQALAKVDEEAWHRLVEIFGKNLPEDFRELFLGRVSDHPGWRVSFRAWFAEELKENSRFRIALWSEWQQNLKNQSEAYQQALTAIAAAMDAVRVTLERDSGDVRASLSQISEYLARQVQLDSLSLLYHPGATLRPPSAAIESFVYKYAVDPFIGRDEPIRELEDGLLNPVLADGKASRGMFAWQIVAAPAGIGKSRFAMELLDLAVAWPVRGFVESNAITYERAHRWPVNKPTFLVIDYASMNRELPAFIQTFARRAVMKELPAPVRVLLLDRSLKDPRLESICLQGNHVNLAKETRLPDYKLASLDDQAIVRLMRNRIGKASTRQKSDAELLAALQLFDAEKRPLFATIVADAMANDALPSMPHIQVNDARRQLFDALLDREEWSVWIPAASPDSDKARERLHPFVNLLVLSTMMRGLPEEHLEDICRDSEEFTNLAKSSDADLWRRMTGSADGYARGSEEVRRLAFLEPDLIGERFVLRHLRSRSLRSPIARKLIDVAWRIGATDVADFIRQCHQDFRHDIEDVDWLISKRAAGRADGAIAIAALSRSIAADLTGRPVLARDPSALHALHALIKRIDVEALRSAADPLAVEDAMAAVQVLVRLIARMLNPEDVEYIKGDPSRRSRPPRQSTVEAFAKEAGP